MDRIYNCDRWDDSASDHSIDHPINFKCKSVKLPHYFFVIESSNKMS